MSFKIEFRGAFCMLLEAWHEGDQIISTLQSAGRKAAACAVELSDQRMPWSSSILQVWVCGAKLGLRICVCVCSYIYICCSQTLPPELTCSIWICDDSVMILWFVADLLSLLVPNVDATNHIDGATAAAAIERSGCLGANQATSSNWPSRKQTSKKR